MTPTASHRNACRVLARLLAYPDAGVRADLPAIAEWLQADRTLSSSARLALAGVVAALRDADPLGAEAAYVECFDRGRRTCLHLFEHVHGDSRDRGPAMVDLRQTYERAGLELAAGELPDHLGVVLEFASTQSDAIATEFLGEMAHILNALHGALLERSSPYAAIPAAVLELAGSRLEPVPLDRDDEPLDESWAEPAAFDGCTAKGQAKPGQPQPLHFVPRAGTAAAAGTSTASGAPA